MDDDFTKAVRSISRVLEKLAPKGGQARDEVGVLEAAVIGATTMSAAGNSEPGQRLAFCVTAYLLAVSESGSNYRTSFEGYLGSHPNAIESGYRAFRKAQP